MEADFSVAHTVKNMTFAFSLHLPFMLNIKFFLLLLNAYRGHFPCCWSPSFAHTHSLWFTVRSTVRCEDICQLRLVHSCTLSLPVPIPVAAAAGSACTFHEVPV